MSAKMHTYVHQKTRARIFTASLFVKVQECKQRKCPSTFWWISELWHSHTVEYPTRGQKHTAKGMRLQIVMVNNGGQTPGSTGRMIPFVERAKPGKINLRCVSGWWMLQGLGRLNGRELQGGLWQPSIAWSRCWLYGCVPFGNWVVHLRYMHFWHAYYAFIESKNISDMKSMFSLHSYRLAPKYHFPTQFEDVYNALKWFLHEKVLAKYGVNPERVAVSGDSAGGNLAAAVTQQVRCSSFLGLSFFFK